jgi:hypothetical protein
VDYSWESNEIWGIALQEPIRQGWAAQHRTLAVVALVASAVVVPCIAFATFGSPGARDGAAPSASVPVTPTTDLVSRDQDGTIVVDFSEDPEGAFEALSRLSAVDNGLQIRVEGIESLTPEERRIEDERLSAGETPVAPQLCLPSPVSDRSDGGARAYLGCDRDTGQITWGAAHGGSGRLEQALREVFRARYPSFGDQGLKVVLRGSVAELNFSTEFARTIADAGAADFAMTYRAILFTAHTDASISRLRFSMAGDCLAFASLLEGDTCMESEL